MSKVTEILNNDNTHFGWAIMCPACKDAHIFDNRWTFNEDIERPTFRASMLSQWRGKDGKPRVCHSFVTDGKIEYLGDCTHGLAGKTVELPEFSWGGEHD